MHDFVSFLGRRIYNGKRLCNIAPRKGAIFHLSKFRHSFKNIVSFN